MSEVGHSLSTIFSRMGNIKLSRLKSFENDSGEDLSNVETVLRQLGVELRDSNGQFKNFGGVLDEVAAKWSSYDSVEQRALATAFASKTNMEDFFVLMQNYSKATSYATTAAQANGTAMQKMSTYTESIEAKQKKLTAATEGFSSALINSELIKFSYDQGTGILGFLTQVTETLGALPVLATAAAAALSFKNQGSSIEYAPSCPMGRMAKTRIWCASTAT